MKIFREFLKIAAALALTSLCAGAQTQTCSTNGCGTLTSDCTTSAAIIVGDGCTLNGNHHLITVVDPPSGSFSGPVITNAPGASTATVENVIVDTPNLKGCATVYGILFSGVSGTISGNTLLHIDTPACPGIGVGIKLANISANTSNLAVKLTSNQVLVPTASALFVDGSQSQNGSTVVLNASGNEFSAGGSEESAPDAVFLFQAGGTISNNRIETDASGHGIAILVDESPTQVKVVNNNINLLNGNASVGIDMASDHAVMSGNRVFNYGANNSTATGILNQGNGNPLANKVTNNEVACYGTAWSGPVGNGNVALSCPWP
jgi:hypothetical protein